jgi:DNA ligase D-like protein (predicted ligase)
LLVRQSVSRRHQVTRAFDGRIPKGQYGAGEMWVYALGRYQLTKEKKDGFYFKLNSREISGEYRIYKTKEKEWLLERVDEPQLNFLRHEIHPMLSDNRDIPPIGDEFIYEIKWDGIRALVTLEDENITIRSRNQNDVTQQFPELQLGSQAFRATNGVFDAEIVCLDSTGKPVFKRVINRLMTNGATNIEKLSKTNPVYCYVFDCLYLDGRSIINESLMKRKEWLKDCIRPETAYRMSEHVEDGTSLFNAAKDHALEGIMAKKRDSKYLPGKRSDHWLKIKVRQTTEFVIIGYTQGKGNRDRTFGALHIAEQTDKGLQYRGKVGTGFNDKSMQEIFETIGQLKKVKKPAVSGKLLDEKISTWVAAKLIAEVSYSMITTDKMFREPVFVRMRPDLLPTS